MSTNQKFKRKCEMRRFHLVRKEDESGVSGTGVVAEGVKFSSGACTIEWLSDISCRASYNSWADLIAVHGHEGRTVIEWLDNDGASGSASPGKPKNNKNKS